MTSAMLYNYIKTHYKQAEPIFLSDLLRTNISDDGEVLIGNRRFYIRKPIVPITKENVYILQMLELLKNLDAYLDCTCEEAREKFAEYISVCEITKSDVEMYIKEYPESTLKYYYKLELDKALT